MYIWIMDRKYEAYPTATAGKWGFGGKNTSGRGEMKMYLPLALQSLPAVIPVRTRVPVRVILWEIYKMRCSKAEMLQNAVNRCFADCGAYAVCRMRCESASLQNTVR